LFRIKLKQLLETKEKPTNNKLSEYVDFHFLKYTIRVTMDI